MKGLLLEGISYDIVEYFDENVTYNNPDYKQYFVTHNVNREKLWVKGSYMLQFNSLSKQTLSMKVLTT